MPNPPLHPVPVCTQVDSWQRCPNSDFGARDPAFEQATAGTVLGAAARLVAGYNPATGTFSRTPAAYQITQAGPELGFAHMAHSPGNADDVINDLAIQLPDVAAAAWGAQEASRLRDRAYVKAVLDSELGGHKQANDWFLAGWNWAMQRPDARAVQFARWYSDIAAPAIRWAQQAGMQDARTLAAGIRMRNSSGSNLRMLQGYVEQEGEERGRAMALAEYGHADRTAKINSWPEFQTSAIPYPNLSDVQFGAGSPVSQTRTPNGVPTDGLVYVSSGGESAAGMSTAAKAGIAVVVGLIVTTVGYFALRKAPAPPKKKRRRGRRGRK